MKLSFLSFIFCTAIAVVPASAQTPDPKPVYNDPSAKVEARVEDLLARLSTDEKIKLLGGAGFTTQPIERLGVPAFRMSDASCGVRYQIPSPAYTASVCLAATWDTALAQRVGVSLGRDARARGVNYLLGPGVNLYRAPMCGRNFEYLGEDPVLSGMIAAGFIRGVQSQGVAATLKHFAVNNQEFSRHDLSSDVDERTLRELYLRTFQIALREGRPEAVMSSYNPVNGVHASQNGWLLNDVLKGEWNFHGRPSAADIGAADTSGYLVYRSSDRRSSSPHRPFPTVSHALAIFGIVPLRLFCAGAKRFAGGASERRHDRIARDARVADDHRARIDDRALADHGVAPGAARATTALAPISTPSCRIARPSRAVPASTTPIRAPACTTTRSPSSA